MFTGIGRDYSESQLYCFEGGRMGLETRTTAFFGPAHESKSYKYCSYTCPFRSGISGIWAHSYTKLTACLEET